MLSFHTRWILFDQAGSFYRSSSRRPNFNARRKIQFYAKQEMLRSAPAFAEDILVTLKFLSFDEFDPSSSQGSSCFKCEGGQGGFNENKDKNKGAYAKTQKSS